MDTIKANLNDQGHIVVDGESLGKIPVYLCMDGERIGTIYYNTDDSYTFVLDRGCEDKFWNCRYGDFIQLGFEDQVYEVPLDEFENIFWRRIKKVHYNKESYFEEVDLEVGRKFMTRSTD